MMIKLSKFVFSASISATTFLLSSPVWAGEPAPLDVPEPGLFGIVAAGAAAVILMARFRSKM